MSCVLKVDETGYKYSWHCHRGLSTVCCVLCAVLCALCCVLCDVCCVLCAVWCVMCVVCCVLYDVWCVLCAVCCVLCVVCCVLCDVCCMMCVVCYVLCVVCCVLSLFIKSVSGIKYGCHVAISTIRTIMSPRKVSIYRFIALSSVFREDKMLCLFDNL
jgi:hypothetical protein